MFVYTLISMHRLHAYWKHYHRHRFWHINGNIILASLFSTGLTALFIEFLTHWTTWIGIIVVITAIADAALDVLIYTLFSYYSASYFGKIRSFSFLCDLARIQGHRIFLAPLYYVCALLLQSFFLMIGMRLSFTVILAYLLALLFTRLLHTLYGLRTGLFEKKK